MSSTGKALTMAGPRIAVALVFVAAVLAALTIDDFPQPLLFVVFAGVILVAILVGYERTRGRDT